MHRRFNNISQPTSQPEPLCTEDNNKVCKHRGGEKNKIKLLAFQDAFSLFLFFWHLQDKLTPGFLQTEDVGSGCPGSIDHLPDPLEQRIPLLRDRLRGREHDLVLDQSDPHDPGGPGLLGGGAERESGELEVFAAGGVAGGGGKLE